MSGLHALLDRIFTPQMVWTIISLGLGAITVTLLLLMWTRWGQYQPLRKCVILSVVAHLLLAAYTSTVQVVLSGNPQSTEPAMRVSSVEVVEEDLESAPEVAEQPVPPEEPWELLATDDPAPAPDVTEPNREETSEPALDEPPPAESVDLAADLAAAPIEPDAAQTPEPSPAELDAPAEEASPAEDAAAIEAPEPEQRPDEPEPLPETHQPERPADIASAPLDASNPDPTQVPSELLTEPTQAPRLADLPRSTETEAAIPGPVDVTAPPVTTPADVDLPVPVLGRLKPVATHDPAIADTAAQGTSPPRVAAESADPLPGAGEIPLSGEASVLPAELTSPPELAASDPNAPPPPPTEVPELYRERLSPDREAVAAEHGGGADTEAAVNAALAWLARHQSTDGRWSARQFGAGREQRVAGQDRSGAGAQADTGVTGLALLAYLGAGYTHLSGEHQATVRKGLEYLLRTQAPNGSLGGQAEIYSHMYCHAMAAIAVSEAYALSRDKQLAAPLRRAVQYTLRAQHPTTGGWRYQPGDLGDTSQLGWQLMVLKSAELAGLAIPARTRDGAARFLQSVASGPQKGLASYRPGERATRTMTAEALVCRQLLGQVGDNAPAREAASFLLGELPGAARANYYYWYYATLALFQLQGDAWPRWNDALQSTLLASQRSDGDLAGSWDANDVWGGHGGRVYSTAMAALCLEVYYRYLPLFGYRPEADAAGRPRPAPPRR